MASKELKTNNKFFQSFTVKQLIAFIIALLFIAFGLILLVLGLIDDYGDIYRSILTAPNEGMKSIMGGIGFTYFGLIVSFLGTIILAFTLSLASKGEDRLKDKEARRKQRLNSLSTNKEATDSTISNTSTSSFSSSSIVDEKKE